MKTKTKDIYEQPSGIASGKVKSPFRKIYQGVRIPWGQLAFALLITMVNYFLLAMTTGTAADIVAGKIDSFSTVVTWAGLHLAAYLLSILEVTGTLACLKVVYGVQTKLWEHIIRLPVRIYDKESPARLISRVTNDANYAATPFTLAIAAGSLVVVFVFGLVNMSAVNTTMLLVFVIGFLLVGVYILSIMGIARKAGAMVTDRLSGFTAYLSERLASIRLIKASVSEEKELAAGEQLIEERYRAGMYNAFATLLSDASTYLGLLIQFFAAFFVGAIMLERGAIEDGAQIYSFYTYGMLMAQSLVVFIQYPVSFAAMLGQVGTFTAVLDTPVEDTDTGVQMPAEMEDIVLRDVAFRYDEDTPVLRNVNVIIPKGRKTAIIGANGTGKSTLMKMIDRLYTHDGGSICYGDTDAAGISLHSWRDRFGMVAQNACLFSGTIRDNICYGIDREITDEELQRVAAAADLDKLIAGHPEGFNFNVGESGAHLSGGEQQRVSIARAMMKNPDFLILDEATANLDASTAAEIQENLRHLMDGRTTIMIAHSPAIVRSADNIIVMENGTVTACGTHEELLEESNFYRNFLSAECGA